MNIEPHDMGWLSGMKKTNPLWVMKQIEIETEIVIEILGFLKYNRRNPWTDELLCIFDPKLREEILPHHLLVK